MEKRCGTGSDSYYIFGVVAAGVWLLSSALYHVRSNMFFSGAVFVRNGVDGVCPDMAFYIQLSRYRGKCYYQYKKFDSGTAKPVFQYIFLQHSGDTVFVALPCFDWEKDRQREISTAGASVGFSGGHSLCIYAYGDVFFPFA